MEKYKNRDGIELSYTGNDSQSMLVREVIGEAIKILGMYDRNCKISMGMAMSNARKFLKTNFDIDNKRDTEWVINQFNRNRDPEDQVKTIEEMEKKVSELFGEKINPEDTDGLEIGPWDGMETTDNNNQNWIYESPDGGKTLYRRKLNDYNNKEKI